MSHVSTGARVDESVQARVVIGARRAVSRWGLRRSSVDDIAREAGVSRATVYRVFPGGKDAVMAALVADERARFQAMVAGAAQPDLESTLVGLIIGGSLWFAGNDALQHLLQHEQDVVGPYLAFHTGDALTSELADLIAPALAPFLAEADLVEATEWFVRLVKTHLLDPSAFVALADTESVRRLVRTFCLPALTTA
jgi:AcrR family transcriptional regulator